MGAGGKGPVKKEKSRTRKKWSQVGVRIGGQRFFYQWKGLLFKTRETLP